MRKIQLYIAMGLQKSLYFIHSSLHVSSTYMCYTCVADHCKDVYDYASGYILYMSNEAYVSTWLINQHVHNDTLQN